MPQSLAKNYIHIVFSTKYRQPFITDDIEHALVAYLGAMCKDMDSIPIKIGGYRDHVHMLCVLSRKVALMDLVEEIKSHSSQWMRTQGDTFKNFYWQRGYAAFSVSPGNVDRTFRYIENQKNHHRKISFQNEMRSYLKKYKIDFLTKNTFEIKVIFILPSTKMKLHAYFNFLSVYSPFLLFSKHPTHHSRKNKRHASHAGLYTHVL